MRSSKESRVLLGLVLGSIVVLCVPFAWSAKLICGPLSLAAVFLAGRQQSRLRPDASMDERDFLLVSQAFGLLTILAWALFMCYIWPMRPSANVVSTPTVQKAERRATPPMLLARSQKIGPRIPKDRDYWFWIDQDNALVIKGRKSEPCTLLRHDLLSGREVRLGALSRVYSWGLHNHTTVSPDGKWLLWRNQTEESDQFCVASLDPAEKRTILKWNDDADEHEDMQFLPDSRHWMLVDRRAHEIEIYDINRPKSRRVLPVSSNFSDASFIDARGSILNVEATLPPTFGKYRHDVDPLITDGATEATIVSARLLPKPHVATTSTIKIPTGTRYDSCTITRSGDRIAWLCVRPGTNYDGDGQIASVCVTDGQGRFWRETGQFPAREKGDANYVSALHLAWTSDGKRLRFEWRDGIREVSVDPSTAGTPHLAMGVPELASIAGFRVGDTTIDEVERRLGQGYAYTGGHPRGAREWKLPAQGGFVDADGMPYYSSGRGRVMESFNLCTNAFANENAPEARGKPQPILYQGAVRLGMTRDAVVNVLSEKFGRPSKISADTVEWTAEGYQRINSVACEDERSWSAVLRFNAGKLTEINVVADSASG